MSSTVSPQEVDKRLSLNDFSSLLLEKLPTLKKAQEAWRSLSIEERVKTLKAMRLKLSRNSDEYVRAISLENGKTELESLSQEVIPILDTLEFLEKNASEILRPKPLKLRTKQFYFKGKEHELIYEPYGVIGILGTWNYPFYLCLSQVLFAIVAGNAVILKGAEYSERITDVIQELLIASGFPEELFYCFSAGSAGGEALSRLGCDKYILTGSRRTGQAVLKILNDKLTPSVMELSGSDPYIILSDADWDLAARTLLWASFQYSGQTCVAPRRVFILEEDKPRFLEAFRSAWEKSGEFLSQQGMLRLNLGALKEKEKIEQLRKLGAKLEFGEVASDSESSYCPAQVYSGLPAEALEDVEFMAPVFFLVTCQTESEILEGANKSRFALGASLWTRDSQKARLLAQKIRAGQLWVNDSIFSVALGELPFRGFKESGFGVTRGPQGLLEMVEEKLVSYDWREKRVLKHLPPYEKNSYAVLNQIQRILYLPWSEKLKAVAGLVKVLVLPKKS